MAKRIIAIQKLNNIVVSRLQNFHVGVISDRWWYNTNQDWKMLGQDFKTFITNPIPDKTLQALCLYIFALEYQKDEIPCFENITNVNNLPLSVNAGLDCKPERKEEQEEKEDNRSSKFTDSKENTVKKKNKCTEKRKTWLASFCATAKLLLCLEPASTRLLPKFCSELPHSSGSLLSRPGSSWSLCLNDFQLLYFGSYWLACLGSSQSPLLNF